MTGELIEYNKSQMIVKTERDLPKHISFDEYREIYYSLEGKDQLLCGLLWNTGGRISDILNLKWTDINFGQKTISLFIDKRDITITVPIDEWLINDLKNMMLWTKPEQTDYLFESKLSKTGHITRQAIFMKMRDKWALKIDRRLTPHMFRHGLAIHLLANGINIKVIAARLGHANVFTTMNYYLVVTPDVQRALLKNVPMR